MILQSLVWSGGGANWNVCNISLEASGKYVIFLEESTFGDSFQFNKLSHKNSVLLIIGKQHLLL